MGSSFLLRPFYNRDFFVRQAVEFVDQVVDFVVCGQIHSRINGDAEIGTSASLQRRDKLVLVTDNWRLTTGNPASLPALLMTDD